MSTLLPVVLISLSELPVPHVDNSKAMSCRRYHWHAHRLLVQSSAKFYFCKIFLKVSNNLFSLYCEIEDLPTCVITNTPTIKWNEAKSELFSYSNLFFADREHVQEMPLCHPLRSRLQQETCEEDHQEALEQEEADQPGPQGLCRQSQGSSSRWHRIRGLNARMREDKSLLTLVQTVIMLSFCYLWICSY